MLVKMSSFGPRSEDTDLLDKLLGVGGSAKPVQ
jgi:hypothetical protein